MRSVATRVLLPFFFRKAATTVHYSLTLVYLGSLLISILKFGVRLHFPFTHHQFPQILPSQVLVPRTEPSTSGTGQNLFLIPPIILRSQAQERSPLQGISRYYTTLDSGGPIFFDTLTREKKPTTRLVCASKKRYKYSPLLYPDSTYQFLGCYTLTFSVQTKAKNSYPLVSTQKKSSHIWDILGILGTSPQI